MDAQVYLPAHNSSYMQATLVGIAVREVDQSEKRVNLGGALFLPPAACGAFSFWFG
jgi:hypothetical protein